MLSIVEQLFGGVWLSPQCVERGDMARGVDGVGDFLGAKNQEKEARIVVDRAPGESIKWFYVAILLVSTIIYAALYFHFELSLLYLWLCDKARSAIIRTQIDAV